MFRALPLTHLYSWWTTAVFLFVSALLILSANAACPTVEYGSGTRFSTANFAAGANININAGQVYLFDLANSPTYGSIYINGGTLVFADEKTVELNAAYILVKAGGKLIIGSCDCPFQNKAILTFWGTNAALNPDGFGTKGLAADTGGTVLLFGAVFGPSWTTLGTSAAKGATSITLSETVTWKVGDVLALSSSDYDPGQDEVVTVASVSGATVTFTPALVYGHYAATHNGMETRTHVARLTRNILIRGDLASTTTTSRFGAHTMFANDFTEVRLSGVEITRAGQAGVLARYPVHFHFAKNVADRAFVKDVSVHDCFQRCYTVHHTDNLLLQRNVGYNTFGHCFFLEDGVEVGNKFYWNLGMVVEKPAAAQRLLPSDDDPAVFWVTNPNNTWIANAAAGSPAHCWWFALPVNPMGPSATNTMCPRRTPLGLFQHNSAHSCMQDCMHIDSGPDANGVPGGTALAFTWADPSGNNYWSRVGSPYNPVSDPVGLDKDVTPVEAVFESFSAWRCNNRGTWTRSGLVTFTRPKFADCAIGITFATNAYYGHMYEGTFIGQTNNMGNPASWVVSGGNVGVDGRSVPGYNNKNFPLRGYEFYDGPNSAFGIKCFNFKVDALRPASCVSMLRQDEFSIAISNEAKGLTIADGSINVNFPDRLHDGDRQSVFHDLDGSVTGRPPSGDQKVVVVNASPFLKTSSCIDVSASQGVYYCPDQYGVLDFDWRSSSVTYPALAGLAGLVKLTRADLGGSVVQWICGGACNSPPNTDGKTLQSSNSFQATIPLWKDIALRFATSPPAVFGLRLLYADAFYDAANTIRTESMVAVCYPPSATLTGMRYGYKTISATADMAASLAALRTNPVSTDWATIGKGMFYQDKSTGYVWLRLVPTSVRTAANMRDAYPAVDVQITMSGVGNAVYNCPDISGGSSGDRGLPPVGTAAAYSFGTAPAVIARDSASACSTAPPPPATNPPPPATQPPPPPTTVPPPPPGAKTVVVTVAATNGFTFTPNVASLYVGDTVQWVWDASNTRPHAIVGAADGTACVAGGPLTFQATGVQLTTGTYSYTFTTAGTFYYFCPVGSHCSSGMRGSVVVSVNQATATSSNAATVVAAAASQTTVNAMTSTTSVIASTTAATTTLAITSNAATVSTATTTSASTTAAIVASTTAASTAATTNAVITGATAAAATTAAASTSGAVTAAAVSTSNAVTAAAASTAATVAASSLASASSVAVSTSTGSTTSVAQTTAVAAAAANAASSTTITASNSVAATTSVVSTTSVTTAVAASGAASVAASQAVTSSAASTSAASASASTASQATVAATTNSHAASTSATSTAASASSTNAASTTGAASSAVTTVASSTTSASVSNAVTAAASTSSVASSLASVTGQSSTTSFASTAVDAAIASTSADASTNAALSSTVSSTSAAASSVNAASTSAGADSATSSLASSTSTLAATVNSVTTSAASATTEAAVTTATTAANPSTVGDASTTVGSTATSTTGQQLPGNYRWYILVETSICLDVRAFFADLAQRLGLDPTLCNHDRYEGCESKRQSSSVLHMYYETDYDGTVASQIDSYLKTNGMSAVTASSVSAVPVTPSSPSTTGNKKKSNLPIPLMAIIVIAVVVGAILIALILLVIILAVKYRNGKRAKGDNPYYRSNNANLYGAGDDYMMGGLYGPGSGTSNPLTNPPRTKGASEREQPMLDYSL